MNTQYDSLLQTENDTLYTPIHKMAVHIYVDGLLTSITLTMELSSFKIRDSQGLLPSDTHI